jgi:hypothetical protein
VTILQSLQIKLGVQICSNSNYVQQWIDNFPSQWPCSLRCGSAAVHLLGLRFWIPVGAWMSFSGRCCVCCQVRVSASGWSLAQRSPSKCGVS